MTFLSLRLFSNFQANLKFTNIFFIKFMNISKFVHIYQKLDLETTKRGKMFCGNEPKKIVSLKKKEHRENCSQTSARPALHYWVVVSPRRERSLAHLCADNGKHA